MSSTPAHTTGRRALTLDEFVAYARDRVATATVLLHKHQAAGGFCCSCGRMDPCPQRESLLGTRAHFEAKLLALTGDTLALPTLPAAAAAARPSRGGLARLFSMVRRPG